MGDGFSRSFFKHFQSFFSITMDLKIVITQHKLCGQFQFSLMSEKQIRAGSCDAGSENVKMGVAI